MCNTRRKEKYLVIDTCMAVRYAYATLRNSYPSRIFVLTDSIVKELQDFVNNDKSGGNVRINPKAEKAKNWLSVLQAPVSNTVCEGIAIAKDEAVEKLIEQDGSMIVYMHDIEYYPEVLSQAVNKLGDIPDNRIINVAYHIQQKSDKNIEVFIFTSDNRLKKTAKTLEIGSIGGPIKQDYQRYHNNPRGFFRKKS